MSHFYVSKVTFNGGRTGTTYCVAAKETISVTLRHSFLDNLSKTTYIIDCRNIHPKNHQIVVTEQIQAVFIMGAIMQNK